MQCNASQTIEKYQPQIAQGDMRRKYKIYIWKRRQRRHSPPKKKIKCPLNVD